jgi:hypothetical protein
MSQHDFDIANQGFAAFRADLNNALKALGSLSSGTAEPATTYANQFWYETDTNTLHIRNEANSAWLDLMVIDQTTGSPSFMAGDVGIGTSSPAYNLDVQDTGDATIRLKANSSGAGADDDATLILDCAELGEAALEFYQGGVKKAAIEWFSAGSPDLNFTTEAGTDGVFDFQPNGDLAMRIASDGNVGIGTGSPLAELHVNSGAANLVGLFESTDSGATLTLIDDGTTGGSVAEHGLNTVGNELEVRAVTTLSFETATTERMRISSTGEVFAPDVYSDTVTGRDVFISSTGQLGYVSSTRASKTNIQDLLDVSWLYNLNPVSFQYRVKNEDGTYSDEAQPQPEYGLIAEDVELVNPDLVFYDETENGKELRGIQYSRLISPLLKAIQEQNSLIVALTARLTALEER